MSKLVIVESPSKAKNIQSYLGAGYEVVASVGHIRDLPKKELGVDIAHGFKPKYVNIEDKADLIAKLTEAAATEMEDVVINGMEAVSYVLEESDTACVSFVTEAGFIFEVSGSPKSDENFAALLSMVMASIQAE